MTDPRIALGYPWTGRRSQAEVIRDEAKRGGMNSTVRSQAEMERNRAIAVAIGDIIGERHRQIIEEGYRPEHDDGHDRGERALAAASHACLAAATINDGARCHSELRQMASAAWPFGRQAQAVKPARRDLVIAAALLVAEIERLDRLAASSGTAMAASSWTPPADGDAA